MHTRKLVAYLVTGVGATEIRRSRGKGFKKYGTYQIRLKPADDMAPMELKHRVEKLLKNSMMLGVTNVTCYAITPHSGSFPSISFYYNDVNYEVVLASGRNNGHRFESSVMSGLLNQVFGNATNDLGLMVLNSLKNIDNRFTQNNIKNILPKVGSTRRSVTTPLNEIASIIGDIKIVFQNKDSVFLSLKSTNGKYFANFGATTLFSNDLKLNKNHPGWIDLLSFFPIEEHKVNTSFLSLSKHSDPQFNVTEKVNVSCPPDSQVYKIMVAAFGVDYFLVKQKAHEIESVYVSEDYVATKLFSNLRITQIKYPHKDKRKYLGIMLESDTKKFMIDVRSSSATDFHPNAIRFSMT